MENFGGRLAKRKFVAPTKRSTTQGGDDQGKGKKKVAEGSEKYDKSKFVNAEADSIYKLNRAKQFVDERGIEEHLCQLPIIGGALKFHGWLGKDVGEIDTQRALAHQPDQAAIEIVHEFYANLKGSKALEGGKVKVRSKQVDFGAARINKFFKLKAPSSCWFSNQVMSEVDWDEVLAEMSTPGAEWIYTRKTRQRKNFRKEVLGRQYRIIFQFLCARLMPTYHHTYVNKERALLLYGIVTLKPINFGQIIRNAILESAQGVGNRGYVMPSLITGLCLESGVVPSAKELWEKPMRSLDRSAFNQMKKVFLKDPMVVERRHEEIPVEEPGSSSIPTAHQTMQEYMEPYFEQQAQYGVRLGRLEEQMTEMRARSDAQEVERQAQFAYFAGCFETMHANMMAPLQDSFGHLMRELPPRPPTYSDSSRRHEASETQPGEHGDE